MAPPGGLFGLQPRGDNNSESLDRSSPHATRKDSQFGKHTNQYHPPQGYGYPPIENSEVSTLLFTDIVLS